MASATPTTAPTDRLPAGLGAWLGGWLQALLGEVGRLTLVAVGYVGEFVSLNFRIVMHVIRGEVTRRELFDQMWLCGVRGLPIVLLTVGAVGLVVGVYMVPMFVMFGASGFIGGVTTKAMLREAGPILGATVIAARSGSAIAAEIGTMRVTEQLDALRALATDPVEYLATPRYIALALMVPLLVLCGILAGLLGAALIAGLEGVTIRQFVESMGNLVKVDDLVTGLTKCVVFGELIAVASLHQGFRTGHGSEAVGRATTQSVVLCVLWIHLTNLALAFVSN